MKVYIYAENTNRKGQVYCGDDCDAEENGDLFLWGSGDDAELIEQAIGSLAVPCDRAPQFRHTCDRNVLRYLGGPKVECHYETGKGSYWLPVSDTSVDLPLEHTADRGTNYDT